MCNFERLKGIIAAPFTPMDPNGKINTVVIEKYAAFLIQHGVAGVFVCGTTGEAASMTCKERESVVDAWVKAASGRLKVIVHVGGVSQADAIALAEHAYGCGANAIASIAPYFFKPQSVEDLVDFFAPVANSVPKMPFYYYNMPSMTGVFLPVDRFLELGKMKMPSLAGVKFTHNNLMEMAQCINLDGGKFEVLHGFDEILLSGLVLGVTAAVGSTYNYVAPLYCGIMDAVAKGDIPTARRLQMYSVEIVKIIIKYGGGVRGGKAIMKLIGIDCGDCRLPIARFTDAEYKTLKADLEKIGFFERFEY